MSTRTRFSVGLITLAWLALVAALIAIPFTPRVYCSELGAPTGLNASVAGLVVAGAVALLAIPVGTWGNPAPRTVAILVVLVVATLTGVFGTGYVVESHSVSICG